MQKFGFKMFERKACRHTFLTTHIDVKVNNIADDYWYRLLARMKSIAISKNELPRLPWEQVLFGNRPIGNLPTATKVQLELLTDNKNAREACIDLMPKDLQLTIAEMQTQLKKHEPVLLNLCKDFCQEISYLMHHVEPMAEERFKSEMMRQLPKPDDEVSIDAVLTYLRNAKLNTLFMCLGARFKAEVDNILTFLNMVHEGSGPKDITSFSTPFLLQVVDVSKNFYRVVVKNGDLKGSSIFPNKTLVGSAAALHDLATFGAASGKDSEGLDIGPSAARLRRFAWLISKEEQQLVDEAVKQKLKRRRTELLSPLAITDGPSSSTSRPVMLTKTGVKSNDVRDTCLLSELDLTSVCGGGTSSGSGKSSKAKVGSQPDPEDRKKSLSALFKKKLT